jgi:hypothetical protein
MVSGPVGREVRRTRRFIRPADAQDSTPKAPSLTRQVTGQPLNSEWTRKSVATTAKWLTFHASSSRHRGSLCGRIDRQQAREHGRYRFRK